MYGAILYNQQKVDKENEFNDYWKNGSKPELKLKDKHVSNTNKLENMPRTDLFKFISQEHASNSDLGLFSLLPNAQGQDYEEEQFSKRMKKKKKGRKLQYTF